MSTVDFSQLPPPSLISELSFEVIFEKRKESFIALHELDQQAEIRETLKRESEPVTKLLQENAYLEMLYVAKCNADARSLLLAYAEKVDLDHLALTEYGLVRLLVTPADNTAIPPIDAVYESDERLRERCLLSFDGMNTAGSANAYRYFALSADGRVDGIKVRSDEANPYLLDIVITQVDSINGEASAELVTAVQRVLDPDHVRPVCDRPTVKSSSATNYQIEAQLFWQIRRPVLEVFLVRLKVLLDLVQQSRRSLKHRTPCHIVMGQLLRFVVQTLRVLRHSNTSHSLSL